MSKLAARTLFERRPVDETNPLILPYKKIKLNKDVKKIFYVGMI